MYIYISTLMQALVLALYVFVLVLCSYRIFVSLSLRSVVYTLAHICALYKEAGIRL